MRPKPRHLSGMPVNARVVRSFESACSFSLIAREIPCSICKIVWIFWEYSRDQIFYCQGVEGFGDDRKIVTIQGALPVNTACTLSSRPTSLSIDVVVLVMKGRTRRNDSCWRRCARSFIRFSVSPSLNVRRGAMAPFCKRRHGEMGRWRSCHAFALSADLAPLSGVSDTMLPRWSQSAPTPRRQRQGGTKRLLLLRHCGAAGRGHHAAGHCLSLRRRPAAVFLNHQQLFR